MSTKPPPDYNAIEKSEWKKNASSVPQELESKSSRLITRIRLFMERFGFSENAVSAKVKTDPMFAAHFAKEPRRTGLHEKYAAEWIKSLPNVLEFRVLPKGGVNAIYITSDGNIHHGTMGNRPGKSLDFIWKTGKFICYAMHKYTKEGGGNQDSQFQEMIKLLRDFQSCNDQKCALFVIVDGPYYIGKKIADLRGHVRQTVPKSYALPIEELPNVLKKM